MMQGDDVRCERHPSVWYCWAEKCYQCVGEDAAVEIGRLRAIVDKLPKTANGVPVVPGMKLWDANVSLAPYGPIDVVMAGNDGDYYQPHEWDWDNCYSTKEAAEAAK